MKCDYCNVFFHDTDKLTTFICEGSAKAHTIYNRCSNCNKLHISIVGYSEDGLPENPLKVWPRYSSARNVLDHLAIPHLLKKDYEEAINVLPISPKASAALSRRCLQIILHEFGYKKTYLVQEITALLNETDPLKAIPMAIRESIDAIRSFGNFAAHPTKDQNLLEVIDVEPEEAEWCIEIIEELFQHFYISPFEAKAKKEALNAKLLKAGKSPSK